MNNTEKDTWQFALGVGIGVLALFVECTFVYLLNRKILHTDGVIIQIVGLAIVSWLYFIFVYPRVNIVVPHDEGWIMSSGLKRESTATPDSRSGNREITAQRELQAGPHWVYLWETPSHIIDMNKKIDEVNNDTDELYATDKGEKLLRVEYLITIFPLLGGLLQYIQLKDEADIKKQIKTIAKAALQNHIGEMKGEDVDFGKGTKDKKGFILEVQDVLNKCFGVGGTIPPALKALGVRCQVTVSDLDEPRDVQKARQLGQEFITYREIANQMVKDSKGTLDYEKAYFAVLMGANKVSVDFVKLDGLGKK